MQDLIGTYPLLALGLVLFVGYALSLYLQKYSVPHILVYLVVGFVVSNFVFPEIDLAVEFAGLFHSIEVVALGLIGFKIGTEIQIDLIKQHPKFLGVVLVMEAGVAFIVVFSLTFIFLGDLTLAVLFAGLATPTAPAVTVEIMRRLKSSGELTSKLNWVLAFDDVIAITMVEGTLVFLHMEFTGELRLSDFIVGILQEIGLAIVLGVVIGYLLDFPLERLSEELGMMELTLGTLVFAIGFAEFLNTSVIMTTMVIGATVTNHGGDNYKDAQDLLEIIMSPIIIVFFVVVGSKLLLSDFSHFPVLAILYIAGRSIGKVTGGYIGSILAGESDCVRNNIGFGLLAQGGVALGLSSIINEQLQQQGLIEEGHLVTSTIVIASVVSVVMGALGTTFAVRRAGEVHEVS